jgi:hypothetical protein
MSEEQAHEAQVNAYGSFTAPKPTGKAIWGREHWWFAPTLPSL